MALKKLGLDSVSILMQLKGAVAYLAQKAEETIYI